jgi:hypothetical protein
MKKPPFLCLFFGLFLVFGNVSKGCCVSLDTQSSTDTLSRPILEDKELVKEMSSKIRDSYKAKTYRGVDPAYRKVITEQEVFGETRCIVKYANPEIHNAVIDLFFELKKIVDTPKLDTPKELEWFVIGGEDERGQDWFANLCTAAESTFSPRLYDNEMYPYRSCGKLRMEYLARVLQSETIKTILVSVLEKNNCSDVLLSFPGKKSMALGVDDAMELISKMRETAPDVVSKNKDGIRKFIKTNIIDAVQNVDWAMRDFDARTTAMNILASFNATQDIPLIQQLANESIVVKNSKVVDDERNPRRIKELSERLCKQLRGEKKK